MSRNLLLSGAIVLALIAVVATLAIAIESPAEGESEAVATVDPAGTPVPVVTDTMHRLSTAEDGKVTLTEFLDFECESCGAIYPAIEQLRERYAGRVTFAFRYFPNNGHFNAMNAAAAVEAASKQGKTEAMYQRLFETQAEWGEAQESKRQLFVGFAEDLGLDMDQFVRDLDDPATIERIVSDRDAGLALGVTGTPTIFINERLVELESLEQLVSEIDAALAG